MVLTSRSPVSLEGKKVKPATAAQAQDRKVRSERSSRIGVKMHGVTHEGQGEALNGRDWTPRSSSGNLPPESLFLPKGVVPHFIEKESWEEGIILHVGKGRRRQRSLSKATLPAEAPQVWPQPCWLQGLTFQAQLEPFVKVPRVQAVRTSVLPGHTPASLLLSEPTLQGLRGLSLHNSQRRSWTHCWSHWSST